MTDKIIQFPKPKGPMEGFLGCSECDGVDAFTFAVHVTAVPNEAMHVTHLICMDCGNEYEVDAGEILGLVASDGVIDDGPANDD